MPFLIPLLFGSAAFFAGAFTGAQVDDKIENHPAGADVTQTPSTNKILVYGAIGLVSYLLLRKNGLVK